MDELTPRQRLERHIQKLEEAVDSIESHLEDLKEEVETLRRLHPSLPEVMVVEVAGVKWFTDGWAAIRDAWVGEYTPRDNQPDLGALLPQWEAVTAPVRVRDYAEDTYRALALLSDDTWMDRRHMDELTVGRGFTMHHNAGLGPVIFRDAAGQVAAIQMPINPAEIGTLHNHRPAYTAP